VPSLLAQLLLFMAGADLGYRVFKDENEKFIIIIIISVSYKCICSGFEYTRFIRHHIGKSGCRLESGELSCSSEPNFVLLTLTLQIVSDGINYSSVTSATNLCSQRMYTLLICEIWIFSSLTLILITYWTPPPLVVVCWFFSYPCQNIHHFSQ